MPRPHTGRCPRMVLLVLVFLAIWPGVGGFAADEVLETARQLRDKGDLAGAKSLLREKTGEDPEAKECRTLLADILTSEGAGLLAATPSQPTTERRDQALSCFREARDLCPESLATWNRYLSLLLEDRSQDIRWGEEGKRFLDAHADDLQTAPAPTWMPIFQHLDQVFASSSLPLHRLEVLTLLARDPRTASQARNLMASLKESLQANRKEYIRMINQALALGDADQAETLLRQMKVLFPPEEGFKKVAARIERVRTIQKLLFHISVAIGARDWPRARTLCQDVFKLDPKNIHVDLALKTIEEGSRAGNTLPKITDPRLALKKQLLHELAEAEPWRDLVRMQKALQELKRWALATPEHLALLEDVSGQLAENRLKADENWYDAEALFGRQEWRALKLLLNRNPAFAESPLRVIPLAEMSLTVNAFLGLKDAELLRADARRIEAINPKSFSTRLVNLKLEWDEGNYQAARGFYLTARELDERNPLLKPYARYLWALDHGPKIIMPALLVLFYVLAKLIPLFFALLDRLYWMIIPLIVKIVPGITLYSLERKFGQNYGTDVKTRHFEAMIEACLSLGNQGKCEKYSQVLLEFSPKNPLAIKVLADVLVKKPAIGQKEFEQLHFFSQRDPKNKALLEKLGQTAPQFPHLAQGFCEALEKYLLLFPKDARVLELLGRADVPKEPGPGPEKLRPAVATSGATSVAASSAAVATAAVATSGATSVAASSTAVARADVSSPVVSPQPLSSSPLVLAVPSTGMSEDLFADLGPSAAEPEGHRGFADPDARPYAVDWFDDLPS